MLQPLILLFSFFLFFPFFLPLTWNIPGFFVLFWLVDGMNWDDQQNVFVSIDFYFLFFWIKTTWTWNYFGLLFSSLLFSFLWLAPSPPPSFLSLSYCFVFSIWRCSIGPPSFSERREEPTEQSTKQYTSLFHHLIILYLLYIYEGFWKIIQNKRMFFFPCADVCLLSCVHMGKCTDSQIDKWKTFSYSIATSFSFPV